MRLPTILVLYCLVISPGESVEILHDDPGSKHPGGIMDHVEILHDDPGSKHSGGIMDQIQNKSTSTSVTPEHIESFKGFKVSGFIPFSAMLTCHKPFLMSCQNKFGFVNRFVCFDVFWIQTNTKKTSRQAKYIYTRNSWRFAPFFLGF